ncbi:prepilin-type N-terminal cleavage/methylation domain-containing protein [Patescibacteria group bacterium]|nr:prepilin-type N-terminal cleavage/methylation domain-containing protein [Patescibacteria group bacterium]MBU2459719.1 prepilin-type N-terminal cleavage/methylation domain-containing protein [Patescibacteria group bacterium]MBU2543876.1 prepilin-type N-terminal cleavage/methylation domain-containing protein [Patescibacteria group bacterium]
MKQKRQGFTLIEILIAKNAF